MLLFCLALLNALTDFRSLPAWVDTVANVVWVAAIPIVVLVSVRERRGYRREDAGWGANGVVAMVRGTVSGVPVTPKP